jgi:hypothetical protein
VRRFLWLSFLVACSPEPQALGPQRLAAAQEPLRYGFPIADPSLVSSRIGVDHDPVVQEGLLGSALCTDYRGEGFPSCYDEHDGSDFLLAGGFATMDAGSVAILAAQDGVVVGTSDGYYDRCHADLGIGGVSCDGMSDGTANSVTLEHADGSRTLYWHMKKDSVAVALDQEVRCGDQLGLVGSSGYSSLPHLHFELQDPDGLTVDPYAGPESQEESFWAEQHDDPLLPGPGCTGPD